MAIKEEVHRDKKFAKRLAYREVEFGEKAPLAERQNRARTVLRKITEEDGDEPRAIPVDGTGDEAELAKMESVLDDLDKQRILVYFELRYRMTHGHAYVCRDRAHEQQIFNSFQQAWGRSRANQMIKFVFDVQGGMVTIKNNVQEVAIPQHFCKGLAFVQQRLYEAWQKRRQAVSEPTKLLSGSEFFRRLGTR